MAIDVNAANVQARRMSDSISELYSARDKMRNCRSSITSGWKSDEVRYITAAIDQTIAQIEQAIRDIQSLKADVVNTANQIRQEEIAAQRRAQQQKQRLIAAAQTQVNQAQETLNSLLDKREELEKAWNRAGSLRQKTAVMKQMMELDQQITLAEKNLQNAKSNLAKARR